MIRPAGKPRGVWLEINAIAAATMSAISARFTQSMGVYFETGLRRSVTGRLVSQKPLQGRDEFGESFGPGNRLREVVEVYDLTAGGLNDDADPRSVHVGEDQVEVRAIVHGARKVRVGIWRHVVELRDEAGDHGEIADPDRPDHRRGRFVVQTPVSLDHHLNRTRPQEATCRRGWGRRRYGVRSNEAGRGSRQASGFRALPPGCQTAKCQVGSSRQRSRPRPQWRRRRSTQSHGRAAGLGAFQGLPRPARDQPSRRQPYVVLTNPALGGNDASAFGISRRGAPQAAQ